MPFLALGSLALAALAAPVGAQSAAVSTALTVAPSAVGDEITFHRWQEGAAGGKHYWDQKWILRIVGERDFIAADGQVRPGVIVNVTQAPTNAAFTDVDSNFIQAYEAVVDLEHRQPIAFLRGGGFDLDTSTSHTTFVQISPRDTTQGFLAMFNFQGMRLVPGENATLVDRGQHAGPVQAYGGPGGCSCNGWLVPALGSASFYWSMTISEMASLVPPAEANMSANATGRVDGRYAIELVSERAQSGHLDAAKRISRWFAEGLPFPVLTTYVNVGDEGGKERVFSREFIQMTSFVLGKDAIQWRAPKSSEAPKPEQSPADQRFPADGTDSALPYPLSLALKDADSSPQLSAWKQKHPESHLASATARFGRLDASGQPSAAWQLVVASTAGAAHMVSVERPHGSPAALVQDHGDLSLPSFTLEQLPSGPITLSAAELAWRHMRGADFAEETPNFVAWGFNLAWRVGAPCAPFSQEKDYANAASELANLVVGYFDASSCVQDEPTFRLSVIAARTDLGAFFGGFEATTNWSRAPAVAGQGQRPSAPMPDATQTSGPPMPDLAAIRRDPVSTAAGGAALTTLAVAGLYFAPLLKALVARGFLWIPGYAKIRRSALMDNQVRERLMSAIRADPGLSISDLVKGSGAGWGTVTHHLAVLKRHQMVSSLVDGRHHRYFPVETLNASERGQIAALKHPRSRQLISLIKADVGLSQRELARKAHVSTAAVSWHVRRLEGAGLIARIRNGHRIRLVPSEIRGD